MCDTSAFATVNGTTVGQLIQALLNCDPDAEVVLSTDRLPQGMGRICVQALGLPAPSVVRYGRISGATQTSPRSSPGMLCH